MNMSREGMHGTIHLYTSNQVLSYEHDEYKTVIDLYIYMYNIHIHIPIYIQTLTYTVLSLINAPP